MKKKIAIINQRYGVEVNGGSEYYTKKLAEHLNGFYDVEVLTTTARDYDTWAPYYQSGKQIVDGVQVRRFPVKKTRNILVFKIINKFLMMLPFLKGILEPIWIRKQGPYCPQLIQYIRDEKGNYEVFIFVTYLYYTTAVGLLEVPEKAILVPTAHDEPFIYFDYFRKVFASSSMIIYLTEEERAFVTGHFNQLPSKFAVLGMGIDIPENVNATRFRKKYHITNKYIIYVGRIDSGKKCDEMLSYFHSYKKQYGTELKLVLVGKATMDIPENIDILTLGFLEEQDKYDGIKGAEALVLPSKYESLSISVLEAMALGTLIVVNGRCSVLRGHVEKSKAGVCYLSESEFVECIRTVTQETMKNEEMRNRGIEYVKKNYCWEQILDGYCMAVNHI